jgi:outer membrane protein assembly factor BamB
VAGGYLDSPSRGGEVDALVVKLSGSTGEEIWRYFVPNGGILSVAIDARGDVLAAGGFSHVGATVLKISGATGAEQWRYVADGGEMNRVVVDAAGDVVAAGMHATQPPAVITSFQVAKLAGTNGAERWRTQLPPSGTISPTDDAFTVAVGPSGAVVAGGRISQRTPLGDRSAFSVVKLDGQSGDTLWRHRVRGTAVGNEACYALAIDRRGNAIAGGRTVNRRTGNNFTVAKLDVTTGRELWRTFVVDARTQHGQANAVAIGADGEVFAAGSISDARAENEFVVVRLAARSGARRWRRIVNAGSRLGPSGRSSGKGGDATALVLDADGDVVAVGALNNGESVGSTDLVVAKIARRSGRVLWLREIRGSSTPTAAARAVAAGPSGDVAAAGAIQNVGTLIDFAVVRLP